jgi:hypothetical protein
MRCRGFVVGLTAALLAVSSIIIFAGPAGAISNACDETMNPAGGGNASGLIVACTFASKADAGTQLLINDYDNAVWHYGASRNVNVTVARTGAAPGTTAGQTTITTTATSATQLAITAADVNHSIEFATSNAAPSWTGKFIAPGSFIVCVGAGCTPALGANVVKLSKPTLAGGPLCPGSPAPATCAASLPAAVIVSNGTGRAVNDGKTFAASDCVLSPKMNFKAADVGMGLTGGDLPEGATISALGGSCGTTANSVTLQCVGCLGGPGISAFTGVTATPANCVPGSTVPSPPPCLITTINPKTPDSSTRYVTDGVYSIVAGVHTITSASALFNKQDIGLNVVGNPATTVEPGARILTVNATGTQATISNGTACSPVCFTAGSPRKFTIGKPTKTAPATADVVGQLAIELIVDPLLSPTSPPCVASKVSAFEINLLWQNPGAYNLTSAGTTDFQGNAVSPTSTAQFLFLTSATRFGGFLKQNGTVAGQVLTTTGFDIKFEFLPVAAGLCSSSGIAETFHFTAISLKQATVPSSTGGGGGGTRSLGPVPEGTTVTYTGASGAQVSTSGPPALPGVSPPNANTCSVTSPNSVQLFCGPGTNWPG